MIHVIKHIVAKRVELWKQRISLSVFANFCCFHEENLHLGFREYLSTIKLVYQLDYCTACTFTGCTVQA